LVADQLGGNRILEFDMNWMKEAIEMSRLGDIWRWK
jgi:hypothetical protein